ncbi:MAG: SpoIIE family protein phosphatase [Bdellovibrionales bacterium]|nr:SpoIIE family protein phosphatase [Bdellovibrionales bacterium]
MPKILENEIIDELKKRNLVLESELKEREQDLVKYRAELSQANTRLDQLIKQLKSELKVVHAIQKSLVPTELPQISGFEFSSKFIPSDVMGGDYFDIFNHQDRLRFGLILASSSGHSMAALFLSVLLKLTSQMESRKGSDPHLVVQLISQELETQIEANAQADLFYGFMDRRNFELSYCKQGQVVALHHMASTGEVIVLPSSGQALEQGFVPPAKAEVVMLNPKDKIILCSRGILESKNSDGESFGLGRLCQVLIETSKCQVHEIRNDILFRLNKFTQFTQNQNYHRDVTLLIMEVNDRVIKLAKNETHFEKDVSK